MFKEIAILLELLLNNSAIILYFGALMRTNYRTIDKTIDQKLLKKQSFDSYKNWKIRTKQ
jgi:hypothetical protein